jgi:hypothetical protein
MDPLKLVSLKYRPLYLPADIAGTHFCYRLSCPQGHSVVRRIISLETPAETLGNRICYIIRYV